MQIYTLKRRLVLYFSMVMLTFTSVICIGYGAYISTVLSENLFASTLSSVRYMMGTVDRRLEECVNLSNWIYVSRDLGKVFVRDYTQSGSNYNLDVSTAQKLLDDRINSASVGRYITAVVVGGYNNVILKYGAQSDYIDPETLAAAPWFSQNSENAAVKWVGLQPSMVEERRRMEACNIPLVRGVIYPDSRKNIGWQYITFSPNMIAHILSSFDSPKGDLLFLLDSRGQCIYTSNSEYAVGTDLQELLSSLGATEGNRRQIDFYGEKKQVVFYQSEYSGFTLVQLINSQTLQNQSRVVGGIVLLILLLSITLGAMMLNVLSTRLTTPLYRVIERVRQLGQGEFLSVAAIEGADEIGTLGIAVNRLGLDIQALLDQVKQEERAKKDLELKFLQNQINPHFVYNALNSIKLIAQMQQSESIYHITASLGALLKEASKGVEDEISLRQELFLLEMYMEIQKIQKKGLVRLECQVEEGLMDYKIPKFTLQPLVENAILHGFSGKLGIGIIEVFAQETQGKLVISVRDNGKGIPPEQLEKILSGELDETTAYRSVGIQNITDRIRLAYGEGYGLSFESKLGSYTLARLSIPARRQEGGADDQSSTGGR